MADATTTDGWTLETAVAQIGVLSESVQSMQGIMAENTGWSSLTESENRTEYTRQELNQNASRCRIMAAMNPLVKRGGIIRAGYVWGQGLGLTAKDEAVNEIVQEFLDDDENRAVLTGHQAHLDLENRLYTDGNVFISLWTDPLTGRVRPRVLEFTEIVEKITNPEDKTQAWFYRREYTVNTKDLDTGAPSTRTVVQYFPDIRHRPRMKPVRIQGAEVRWDAPVLHVHDNALTGSLWGLGDALAALPWAKAYSGFLDDWAKLTKALSKIAWRVTSPTRSKAMDARQNLSAMGDPSTGAGGTVNLADMKLESVSKSGATIDAESGRPIAAMVGAAVGLPVTMLLADPGQTGARAVAETLDQPTELEFTGRRELWTEALRAILNYVVDRAALAPRSPHDIRGVERREGDRVVVDLTNVKDRTLVFDWPDLTGDDPATVIEAALKALDTGKFQGPAEVRLVEIVLRAFRVRDVDELLDKIKDPEGNLLDLGTNVGDAAIQAFRKGEDPNAQL